MRLHEDDSHIVEEQEQRDEILDVALDNVENDKLIEDAVLSAMRSNRGTMIYFFEESKFFGEIEDRFIDELVQREIDKRKQL